MGRRSLVQNAGSERQVRRAERKLKEWDDRFLAATEAVLATPVGRAFIYGLLKEAGLYRSVWHDHGSRMAFNAGQQDYGHWLYAQCLEANEDLVVMMEREGRAWQRKEDTTLDAQDRDAEQQQQEQGNDT